MPVETRSGTMSTQPLGSVLTWVEPPLADLVATRPVSKASLGCSAVSRRPSVPASTASASRALSAMTASRSAVSTDGSEAVTPLLPTVTT